MLSPNIVMVRGDTIHRALRIRDRATGDIYTLAPTDTVFLEVKKRSTDTTPLIQKVITSDNYTDEGELVFSIYPNETKDLSLGEYLFDARIKIDDNDKDIYTILPKSKLLLKANITDIPSDVVGEPDEVFPEVPETPDVAPLTISNGVQKKLINTLILWATLDRPTTVKEVENDYEKLINQPALNGVTLIKNKSLKDVGVQSLSNIEIQDIWDSI